MLRWEGAHRFAVGDVTFVTLGDGIDPEDDQRALYVMSVASAPNRFVIAKTNATVEFYAGLLERHRPRRIVELGIFRGGSTALLALLAKPERLVAFELESERVPELDELVDHLGLADRVSLTYGIDQTDRDRIAGIVTRNMGEPIDLVIDDASHQLDATRVSFDTLFPMLAPGGHYVIEDWDWAHVIADSYEGQSISPLVVEAMLASSKSRGTVVSSVETRFGSAVITRGTANLDASFRLGDWCDDRDVALLGISSAEELPRAIACSGGT